MRDIKTKETRHDIKTLNKHKHLSHYEKKQQKESPTKEAVEHVENTGKTATAYTTLKSKRIIREKIHRKKEVTPPSVDSINPQPIHISRNMLNQFKTKVQNNVIIKKTLLPIQSTLKVTKRVTKVASNLISLGISFLMMMVIILFLGIFSALSNDSGINSSLFPLSEEVIEYTDTIQRYAKEYDIEEYVSLIQAVMMHESQGIGNDPMQATDFPYNNQYPNGIENADYSINVGVHYLSDCIKKANVESITDMSRFSLAIQGYDYGIDYIQWALNNFGGYTRANASVYSDNKKQELNVNQYGNPAYVPEVLKYYHIGNGDIVLIAKTQIGNIGGKPYWEWYGFNNRVEWCAIFVSWCANESGQLNVSIPQFSIVNDGIDWYKEKGLWIDKTYTPKAGDLIFFDWENDGSPDHVGIVEKVQDNNIFTIEGNSNDECRERCYRYAQNCIYGYGVVFK